MSRRLLYSALVLLAACKAPSHPPVTGKIDRFEIASQNVSDTFAILVRTPPGYDPTGDPYPVVVQLDATFSFLDEFNVTAGHASELEETRIIEPTVVVGIGYPYQDTETTGRFRDYPPTGAPAFYAFIKDELIPEIDSRYHVMGADRRVLFGHSYGGLFSLYALFQHDSHAPLFAGFVAASPSILWKGGELYDFLPAFLDEPEPPALYMTVGGLEGPEMNVFADEMAKRLKDGGYDRFSTTVLPFDHLGTISPSYRTGLERFIGAGR